MRILLVATKSPWPPVGGGNVAVHRLVSALRSADVDVTVLALGTAGTAAAAPYPVQLLGWRPHPWWRVAHHLLLPPPPALARFRSPRILREIEAAADRCQAQVIHLEQLHLAWTAAGLRHRAPVLLRQQNVESLILQRLAALWSGPRRAVLRRESRRMARAEAAACRTADMVAAISEPDAARLRALAPEARIAVLPVAFHTSPPAQSPTALEGTPPLICIGSFDWAPSRDGGLWLVRSIWPRLRSELPDAVLHLAGPGSDTLLSGTDPRVRQYGVIDDPAALLDRRGIVLVPVRAGSGVRLRLLEAWAAGVPAVTTPVGGEGLVSGDGDGAAVGGTADEVVAAVVNVARNGSVRRGLVTRGHELMKAFQPDRVAAQAIALYQELVSC